MTEKLYLNNSYIYEFEANIINCTPYNGYYAIILDKTAFYPEGGGQPSDRGYINEHEVLDVIEKDGQVLHIVNHGISTRKVICRIDWNRRYDFMQQHSGQHILSHCFLELFQGNTDSFHLGSNTVSIEIDIKEFSQYDCNKIEAMANEIIYNNLPISSSVIPEEELNKLPLRKQPSVKDNIRIVKIGDIDYNPCGGTHVMATGEVGIIKIVKWEKLKSSYRFHFLCGKRALMDYGYKNLLLQSLCAKLSVKDFDLEKAVDRLMEENKILNKEYINSNKALLRFEAKELYNLSDTVNDIRIIKSVYNDRKFDDIKYMASELTTREKTIALLATINENAQVVFSRSEDVCMDMNMLLRSVLPKINGKGGGSSKTALGGGSVGSIKCMMEEAYDLCLKSLSQA
ncbi:alanyl-tRNA editing protein [Lutispora thermophila]|uniref:Alanyl-tRNA synthetase n=1 Tax=Lutispora thermophila DSM 19022 TaxID=1122184 RepID=A0A1M6DB73_9FIRM|nr:alanine--tRNA ligase-related protein [Lutispora thermophila]SHI70496.1 alanyl-tRNA synthetase [Lutispora thermophila DSM 19022]